ncbi:hypothetical protein EVAR_31022_1 [Eumeta japonica]|uniref:Uncharacterized protein n=1 Tax=Eumeta variegata TaxID=151549 RepID=A0A4C1VG89_EUMVA|nr:hypothetical protein EVAR_31022_1 [Eumeta japonica]
MRSLSNKCGEFLKDTCRNSDVRERCDLKEDVVTRVEKGRVSCRVHLAGIQARWTPAKWTVSLALALVRDAASP